MPRYAYVCKECESSFTITHRYKEKGIECPTCQSSDLVKDLSTPISPRLRSFRVKDKTTGSEVKSAIKDGQQELKKAKESIAKRVYKK